MSLIKLITTDSDAERMLNNSLLMQAEVNAHKKTALKLDTALKFLSVALDEFEGRFNSDEHCDSEEIAQWYVDAAKWMKQYFGRTDGGVIAKVEKWIWDQVLPKPRHPRDYDFI